MFFPLAIAFTCAELIPVRFDLNYSFENMGYIFKPVRIIHQNYTPVFTTVENEHKFGHLFTYCYIKAALSQFGFGTHFAKLLCGLGGHQNLTEHRD